MAGITGSNSKGFRITYRLDGESEAIYLGKVAKKTADRWRTEVEHIIAARVENQPLPQGTARWIAELSEPMHGKLSDKGLVNPRGNRDVVTLKTLTDRFLKNATVKDSTYTAYEQGVKSLTIFFGEDRDIATIDAAAADDWRAALQEPGKASPTKRKMAAATQSARIRVAKRIFKRATRWKMISENPFDHLVAGGQHNPDRTQYIPIDVVHSVLDELPDDQWRTSVALVRFAGLRCPSEVGLLRWGDVLWDRDKLNVRSPKTEGHEGHASRIVPMVPAMRELLERLFEQAPEGEQWVCPRVHQNPKINLRTTLQKAIVRAGHTAWPRLLHNLRASFATDMAAMLPAHAAAKVLGHSPLIQSQNYAKLRDSDIDTVVNSSTFSSTSTKPNDDPTTNPTTQGNAPSPTKSQKSPQVWEKEDLAQLSKTQRDSMLEYLMSLEGLEPYPKNALSTGKNDDAGGVTTTDPTTSTDPDLLMVLEAWGSLPEAVRVGIIAMVNAAR